MPAVHSPSDDAVHTVCPAEFPRLVKHVDERFLSQLTELYRQRIPEGGWRRVLPGHDQLPLMLLLLHGVVGAVLMRGLPVCLPACQVPVAGIPSSSSTALCQLCATHALNLHILFTRTTLHHPPASSSPPRPLPYPPGGAVLDLMSSWVSHLPPEARYSKVVGHGMNAAELARNPRLDTFFVRNLNEDPDGWSAQEQSFDAVICCVRWAEAELECAIVAR